MVKALLSFLSVILVSPLILSWRVYHAWTGREALFVTYSQLLSLIPGKIGVYLRRAYYSMALNGCARDVNVGFGTTFSHPTVKIGQRVYIGSGCTIGMVDIAPGVMIGSNVDILSGRRQHFRDSEKRLRDSSEGMFERIAIGENSWIGNSAVIMARVGSNCAVGAGTVVVNPVPDGQTVVGNPARAIHRAELTDSFMAR
jgi:acetyltransferase-like isoleucine patch superfamily enzyme